MSQKSPYAPFLARWPKEAGHKPTEAEFRLINGFARAGTKDALALAMAFRPEGATQVQIKAVLHQPHRNKLVNLVEQRKARRVSVPLRDGRVVYKLVPRRHGPKQQAHAG